MNNSKPLVPPGISSSKPKPTRNYNLIEALRDQSKAATFGVATNIFDQLTGRTPANQTSESQTNKQFNFEEFLKLREAQVRLQERQLSQRHRVTETLVFYRKEEVAKQQIEVIKQEIKTLVIQTGNLSSDLKEAVKAVAGRIPDIKSGVYYVSFFERIRRLIVLARKRISESQTWLSEFNSRCKTKSYYWNQVNQSGSKFMLSHERYMATQAG